MAIILCSTRAAMTLFCKYISSMVAYFLWLHSYCSHMVVMAADDVLLCAGVLAGRQTFLTILENVRFKYLNWFHLAQVNLQCFSADIYCTIVVKFKSVVAPM
jgi:hypothetical protein